MEQIYQCPTCGCTKTIVSHQTQTVWEFKQQLPINLVCGVRGCEGFAVRVEGQFK